MPITRAQAISCVNATAEAPAINLWYGAVSAGKTVGSLIRFLVDVANAPDRGEIAIIGRTRDTIYRNIFAALQDASFYGEWSAHVEYNRGAPTAKIFGKTVHVIGASDVRAENAIRGMTLYLSYVDEATLLAEEFFAMLVTRHRVQGAKILATTNPDAPRHWLKAQYVDKADLLGHQLFHFRIRDNAQNLQPGYIDGLEKQYSGLWYRRFIEGEWAIADGVIYSMFNPDKHVVSDLPPMQRLLSCGIDYGVTNATRGILIGLGTDNSLYAVAEWAPGDGTEAERSNSLRDFYGTRGEPEMTFIDPAAAGFRMQVWQSGFSNTFKASNAVIDGLGVVASLMSLGRLKIHESCTELIKELPGYVWDSKAAEKGEDSPIKLDDHACDALRYAVFSSRMLWQPYIDLHAATKQPDNQLEGVAA